MGVIPQLPNKIIEIRKLAAQEPAADEAQEAAADEAQEAAADEAEEDHTHAIIQPERISLGNPALQNLVDSFLAISPGESEGRFTRWRANNPEVLINEFIFLSLTVKRVKMG